MIVSLRSKPVVGYVVRTGTLANDQIYTGIVTRTEETVTSEYPGHVNYYAKDGDRIGIGQLAYTIDESGRISEEMAQQTDSESLSAEDYAALRKDARDYASGFLPSDFQSTYSFKTSLSSSIQKMTSAYILEDISRLSADDLASIHKCTAKNTGIMIFRTDSFDGKTADDLTVSDFDPDTVSAFQPTILESNTIVGAGDPVYKLCTDENWSVTILTDSETAASLEALGYVEVRFVRNRDVLWGAVSTRTAAGTVYTATVQESSGDNEETSAETASDGTAVGSSRKNNQDDSGDPIKQSFVTFTFNNSMLDFVDDRYIRIELLTEQEKGLKVPNSAIIQSNFFLVPEEYITTGTGGVKGVLRETYTEDGKTSASFVEAEPYSDKDGQYYLDESVLQKGDILYKPDSTETFTISPEGSLTGVYNINRGYTDFREIEILYQNDEYSIVRPNTLYGLNEYDRIALNAANITPDMFTDAQE